MTALARRRRRSVGGALGSIAATLIVATSLLPTAGQAAGARTPAVRAAPRIELAAQTPMVARGGTFEIWLDLPDVPLDGSVEVVLHNRVRSRSELTASIAGRGLRTELLTQTTAVSALPTDVDGRRHLTLSLDPALGVAVSTAGAYPLELIARDSTGAPLDSLITHLLVRPDATDDSPPLAVAVVAEVDPPPARRPDGSVAFDASELDKATQLMDALASRPEVPATLAVRPETIDSLASAGTEGADLLDQLRAAATGRSVLALPYVDVSPDALAAAQLGGELTAQIDRGRLVLANALGVDPGRSTWLADRDLGPAGLRALAATGVRHVVARADQLEALRSGVLSLSLAQPFLLADAPAPTIDALALDPRITALLGSSTTPGLEVSRILAELAVLWFEQPGIQRAVVLPVDTSVRGEVVTGLLAGLDTGGPFRATDLDDAFTSAKPLVQPGGGRVDRALTPRSPRRIGRDVASELRATRSLLASFRALLGGDSPRAEPVADQLLLAAATDLSDEERHAYIAAAQAGVQAVTGAITAPDRQTITLTARDGTVPMTLRNAAGIPVDVLVRLRSPKLEFPGGDTIPLTLTEETTRLDIAVRARASGAFPVQVEVTSPDGGIRLASVEYSVRSTAVAGVGVVLSAGAGIFLLVWWARHWRRTRRSAKLVASTHPVHGTAGPP